MIAEDYVSFETAKFLKKKGFDAVCTMIYTADGELLYTDVKHHNMYAVTNKQLEYYTDIIAPSQSMAMKWLREAQKINIEIITYWTKDRNMVYGNRIVHDNVVLKEIDVAYCSYEEACEAAIKYCLETLI